jgi:hypothetical protein
MIRAFISALPPFGSATILSQIRHFTFVVAPSKIVCSFLQPWHRIFMNRYFGLLIKIGREESF